MAPRSVVPPPPPGFVLQEDIPPPPPGFVLEAATPAPVPGPSPDATEGSENVSETDPSFFENPLRALQVGVQGAGRAAADVLGMPGDIANFVGDTILGGADLVAQPFGGSVDFRFGPSPVGSEAIASGASSLAEALGGDVLSEEELHPRERIAYNISRYGTEAIGAGAGLAARAATRAPAIASGSARPTLGDTLSRPYREDALRTFAGDAASGVGAGTAVAVHDEFLPEEYQSELGRAFALLGGGVGGSSGYAGASAVGRGVQRMARDAVAPYDQNIPLDPLTGAPARRKDAEDAMREMQRFASSPETAARSIGEQAAEFRAADLPVPTSGLISDDIGLQSAESAYRTRDRVPFIESDNRLRAASTERVGSVLDPQADQSAVARRAGDVSAMRREAAQREVDQASGQQRGIDMARQEEGAPLTPIRGRQAAASAEASRGVDKALADDTVIPATRAKNEAFDALDPEGTQMVDATPVVEAARTVRQRISDITPEGQQMPGEFVRRIEELDPDITEGSTGQTSLRSLVETRAYLDRAERQATQANNIKLAESISTLRKAINETIEAAPEAAEANRAFREDFAPLYRRGDEMESFQREVTKDQQTRGATPPTETAGRFLSAPDKAAQLRNVLDTSPSREQGMSSVRDYLRADFASVLNDDGTLNAKRAANWVSANSDVLAEFPDIRKEFDDMAAKARRGEALSAEAGKRLKAAQEKLGATERDLDKGVTGTLLREDPRDVADKILSKRHGAEAEIDRVKQVLGSDKKAQRGWKAAFAEALADRVTGTTKLDTGAAGSSMEFRTELAKLDRLFKEKEDLLAKVFSPEEMRNLKQAHRALEPLKNATISATAGSNTADKYENIWRVTEAGLKGVYGVLKGGGILRTMRIAASTLPNNTESVQRLVARAWHDPELAQYFLTGKVRNMNYSDSNVYVRRLLAGSELARGVSDSENTEDQQVSP